MDMYIRFLTAHGLTPIFITKDKDSEWYIYNSQGLISIDKDIEWFGKKTGAFGRRTLYDLQLAEVLSKLYSLMREKYWEQYFELKIQVEILDWSWETTIHLLVRIHTAQFVHPTFHRLHEVEARPSVLYKHRK